ncbi:MAG: Eco57I restriction-modification methylase domain-containing protein, partial [Cyclobacteriaceae bacterium]|nr:Eco57I restriction-modification methylase domain-containing protein [Cyclobacteriaceae bacterium]
MTRDEAKAIVDKLVQRFAEHSEEYHLPEYNEQKTRQDFINPFFKALGWDIDNEKDASEAYREVIYEDKVVVRGKAKAPDYGFRLSGSGKKRLFFVEAKKPSVALKTNKESAYQLKRYGSSALADVSILTNFEDFIVYDCSRVPNVNDSASVSRLKHIHFTDYLKEFDFIYDTFSHEAVTKGRFDKFVQSDTNKKGSQTLDKEFVHSLDQWRKYLATDIARNNKKLDDEEINFAVQQTIDRLIFLRFCEDRAVEPYGQLQKAVSKGESYKNLFDLFKQADDKYNSGLFDFEKDQITPKLKIDNKVIKSVIEELYYPLCRYEFSVMPVEVLGNAYEQFLGKVIRITLARSVKIEEKPEVRKAGGVYYTPQYIVEYIVKNTVGKLIDGKTPTQIEKIKIVDPACGSGSFLLGAFDYLLQYHINWYHNNLSEAQRKKGTVFTPQGTLTTHEKKRILLGSIFGVDLDANAVEVTKLSLLLKCMEGETEASIKQQISLFHERVLPDLDNNIKNGNSLIDFDDEINFGEKNRLKHFNWRQAFPEVFKKRPSVNQTIQRELKEQYRKVKQQITYSADLLERLSGKVEEPILEYGDDGGFDVVIGNPPYVRQELLGDFKEYFEKHYRVFHGMADLYSYFIEKAKSLLRQDGYFGVIVANKWMRANYGEPLRKWLKKINITEITDFGDLPVFQQATAYPCILMYRNSVPDRHFKVANIKTLQFSNLERLVEESQLLIRHDSLDDAGWNLSSEIEQNLLSKIKSAGVPLGEYLNGKIYRGVLTGLNEAFVIDYETRKRLIREDKNCAEVIKPFLAGRDIKRYQLPQSDKFLIFTRRGIDIEKYPSVKKHLSQFKKSLAPKPKDFKGKEWIGRKEGSYKWYEIQDSIDYYEEFEKPKIIIPAIVKEASCCWDESNYYSNDKTSIIPTTDKYFLGMLNSKVCDYYIKSIASTKQGGYFEYKPMYISKLPIPAVNETQRIEITKHVNLLLKINEELKMSKLQSNTEQLKQHIANSEKKINLLVYELYDLNESDIK